MSKWGRGVFCRGSVEVVEEKKREAVAVVGRAIFLPFLALFVRHGVPFLQGGLEDVSPHFEKAFDWGGAHVGLPSLIQSW